MTQYRAGIWNIERDERVYTMLSWQPDREVVETLGSYILDAFRIEHGEGTHEMRIEQS